MRRTLAAAVLTSFPLRTACGSSTTAGSGGGGSSTASRSGDGGLTVSEADVPRDPSSGPVDPTANNAFATDLFSRVTAGQVGQNVFASPVSASLALTVAYAGARGATATQMAKALHIDPASNVFAQQNALTQELAMLGPQALAAAAKSMNGGPAGAAPSAGDYRLDVVNAVWGQQGMSWASPFLDILARNYGTGVTLGDFASAPDAVRQTINTWVSEQTADKVNDLLPEGSIEHDTRMVLVNAIHLKLPWVYPFEASRTAPATFTKPDGTTVQANFMASGAGDEFFYADDGKAQIVTLPLDQGVNVILAMPHGDLSTYEAGLAADPTLLFAAGSAYVTVHVPKLTFTSGSVSLSKVLQAMGMTDAFSATAADFSGMDGARDLYVADVLQKTTLSLAETGVEAAAATAVNVAGSELVPMDVSFDHPFVISIVDPKQTILFLGQVVDPTR